MLKLLSNLAGGFTTYLWLAVISASVGAVGSWWVQSKFHAADKTTAVNEARADERAGVRIVNAGGARLQAANDELTYRNRLIQEKLDAELKKKPAVCPVSDGIIGLLNESARAPGDPGLAPESGPGTGAAAPDSATCEVVIRTANENNAIAVRNAELARELRRTYNEVKDKFNGRR